MNNILVSARSLTKTYQHITALNNINLEIGSGKSLVYLGQMVQEKQHLLNFFVVFYSLQAVCLQ